MRAMSVPLPLPLGRCREKVRQVSAAPAIITRSGRHSRFNHSPVRDRLAILAPVQFGVPSADLFDDQVVGVRILIGLRVFMQPLRA